MTLLIKTLRSRIQLFRFRVLLALCSGVMLAGSFLFPELFPLAWFGVVPLLISLHGVSLRQAYFLGLVCGFSLSLLSCYWISEFIFNLKGYSPLSRFVLSCLFWFYCAHLLAFITLFYCLLKHSTILSDYILFPICVCVLFSSFPLLFSIQLGATQSQFLVALQAIEYTGVYGLDFVIALVNVLIWKSLTNQHEPIGASVSLLGLVVWFGFGSFSLSSHSYYDDAKRIKIGLVQPNEKPSIDIPPASEHFSRAYPPEMALSKSLSDAGAEVVIWPESRFKGFFRLPHVRAAFQYQADLMGAALIFQDMQRVADDGVIKKFNSSVLAKGTNEMPVTYQKRKLVAVGEYMPIFSENSAVRSYVAKYFGDFFSDLSQGKDTVHFLVRDLIFVPMICYEIMFPRFVANALKEKHSKTVLLVQSNDGWFGRTRQPYQHMHAAVLRSVENRLPLIYSTNNGPSSIILPSGRINFESSLGESGGYLIDMPYYDGSERSFFSRYPNAFIYSVYGVFCLLIFYGAYSYRCHRRKCVSTRYITGL